jgi:hypothetical protein
MSAVMLVGGLLVMGTGNGVTQAGERGSDHNQRNPFQQILDKLDYILDAIKGGGGQDGNHTLRWDQALPAAQRFVILTAFNSEAVLDKNTGLVWEKSPQTTGVLWTEALNSCINKAVGGQKGWRLPSISELASLIDPSLPIGPTLPPGHLFLNIQLGVYWSASTTSENPTLAWLVNFLNGFVTNINKSGPGTARPWCVRGGMNADTY